MNPLLNETLSLEEVKRILNFDKSLVAMSSFYRLHGDAVFVRNSKRDAYYTVTPNDCSCPSRTYRPWQRCKHMKAFFPDHQEDGT